MINVKTQLHAVKSGKRKTNHIALLIMESLTNGTNKPIYKTKIESQI